MRFIELPSGARFRFEGRLYTKTNTLTANDETGKSRLIPRSATVAPLDGVQILTEEEAPAPMHPEQIRAALDRYHACCVSLLLKLPEMDQERLRQLLDEARADVEKSLFS
jgi:hypothetical protein